MANLMKLNNIEITDQGRTVSEGRDERSVVVDLASGKKKKYIMAIKKTWTIEWDWLPSDTTDTYDGLAARNQIRAIAFASTVFPLTIRNTEGQENTYTVWVEGYSEDLIRRDEINGVYFYKVTLDLLEQ